MGCYSECLHKDDQKFQCFFSGATWDFYALKRDRPEIFQKNYRLHQVAIDDAGCPKPFARKTDLLSPSVPGMLQFIFSNTFIHGRNYSFLKKSPAEIPSYII